MAMAEDEKALDARLLLHHTVEALGSPGIVVDADLAARTPCLCHRIDGELCHSPGIIGMLSKAQVEAYCPTKTYSEDGLRRRVEKFRGAAGVCKLEIERHPKGERLEPWLRCMGRELKVRGVEL